MRKSLIAGAAMLLAGTTGIAAAQETTTPGTAPTRPGTPGTTTTTPSTGGEATVSGSTRTTPGDVGTRGDVGATTGARTGMTVPAPSTWTRGDAAWSAHVQACQGRYSNYDPSTDSYTESGASHPCPL